VTRSLTLSLVDLSAPCWVWPGTRDANGYGKIWLDNQQLLAHRYIWRLIRGEIPRGLTIDHLCRVHGCVNPQHLELVTQGENTLRGMSPSAINKRKTHCLRGHPYDAANTYYQPDGNRRCRTCKVIHRERYNARRAA
jgi:hypothetical protein